MEVVADESATHIESGEGVVHVDVGHDMVDTEHVDGVTNLDVHCESHFKPPPLRSSG